MLRRLFEYPKMLWRSRGYGVHSPFAFDFITKVIGEKDARYYAYAEIAAFCPRSRKTGFNEIFAGKDMSVPEAWLLFRVLCYFNPAHVLEVGHGHEVTTVILNRAIPRSKVHVWHTERHPDPELLGVVEPFVLVNQYHESHGEILKKYVQQLLANGDVVIFLRNLTTLPQMQRIWKYLCDVAEYGMGFTDGYTGIFVARRALPHQIFKIVM